MTEYIIKLYLAGHSQGSEEIENRVRVALETALQNEYELAVVDVLQHPEQAAEDEVIATPTLLVENSIPQRRTIGRFADTSSILQAVGVEEKDEG